MKRTRNNTAYSFLELMMVFSILAIISVSVVTGLNAVRKSHAIEEAETGIDLREISKQEFLLQGINPEEIVNPFEEYGDVGSKIEKTSSHLNTAGKNDVSLLSAKFDVERDRIHVVGKVIKDTGSTQELKGLTLLPPIANFSGIVQLTSFPLKNFISSAGSNPLGTYYRYTIDGSDPVMSSAVWNFSALNLTHWAPRMKFRAFNQDSRYTESAVLEVALNLIGNVKLKREDGSDNLGVSYSETVNGSNRILLIVLGGGSNVSIRYRIKGGDNIDYKGPFCLSLNSWTSSVLMLIAEIRIPQCSEPIGVQEFNLHIKKEALTAPEIISNCEAGCSPGTIVSIKTDRNSASTATTVDGQDAVFYVRIEDI